MAGGGSSGKSLEQTPTWAVAVVCFVMVSVSIMIEHSIHLFGEWLKKKNKRALYESLEKIKSELMLLGFISLLLTVGQYPISIICIPQNVGSSWHPCSKEDEKKFVQATVEDENTRRRLLSDSGETFRRVLAAGGGTDRCANKGKVPLVSSEGINQLHIFIFILAVFHVIYCILTMALGRLKMRRWKYWEKETKTIEYQFSHDPERFRFARETSFGRRHLNCWTNSPGLIWIVCFFRQFVISVPKVDYLTLRHGFIMAHLAPQSHSKFDFQKYINRSLEEDFKVVVGISPPIWLFAVLFLLFNTHGWYSYLWLPFIPLIIILLIGTKLQVIITKMGLRIQERGEVVKGVPVVEPGDDLFWFNRPRLILYLINFVLFQNAFQLAFFAWTWYEFGLKSCFHKHTEDVVIRMTMGILIQILCSYVTLPLYALVTQMGSSMKPTIFNERVATALKHWHHSAKKHIKQQNKQSGQTTPMSSRPATPMSSRPATPSHGMSPVHLLRHYRTEMESTHTSPRKSNMEMDQFFFNEESAESSARGQRYNNGEGSTSSHHLHMERGLYVENERETIKNEPSLAQVVPIMPEEGDHERLQHEIDVEPKDFSFDKRPNTTRDC